MPDIITKNGPLGLSYSRSPLVKRLLRIALLAGFLLFFAGLLLRFYASAQGVPLLGSDARVFLPQTISFREKGELINRVWPAAAALNRTGQRMVYHGFLFPMLIGGLMPAANYLAAIKVYAAFQAIAILSSVFLLFHFARLWRWKFTPGQLSLLLLFSFIAASYARSEMGRPEPLPTIILCCAVMALSRVSILWGSVIAGIAIGLVTASDPVIGPLAGLVFSTYCVARSAPGACLQRVALAGGVSLLSFGACAVWYPYSLAEWVSGTRGMGSYALGNTGSLMQWHDTFSNGATWRFIATIALIVLALVQTGLSALRSSWRPPSPILFVATLILTVAAFCRFSFYAPWTWYNLLPFVALGLVPVLLSVWRTPGLYRWLTIALALFAALSFPRDLLERAYLLRASITLPQARERFAEVRARYPDAIIALHKSLFPLTEDLTHIVFADENGLPADATLWVYPQAHPPPQRTPPKYAGFELMDNEFNQTPATFFGFPLWFGEHGCGFAVYRRVSPE